MRAVDQQLPLQALIDDGVAVHGQLDADHRALDANLLDQRAALFQRLEALAETLADLLGPCRAGRPLRWSRWWPGRPGRRCGLPPKVAACVPGFSFSATCGRAIRPPQATPPASALASVTTSGWTSQCW